MKAVDTLIINSPQVVTCASNGTPKRGAAMQDVGIIENGALAIHQGVIVAVGKSADIQTEYVSEHVIDAQQKAVLPGFVDCHTHTVYGGNRYDEFEMRIQGRTYMEIMAAGGGIHSTTRATRHASHDELLTDATRRFYQMLELGTTTAEIKTGYGLDTPTEVKMLEVIAALAEKHPMRVVPTFLGAHAVPPETTEIADYVALIEAEMLPAIISVWQDSHFSSINQPLYMDIFCEKGVFDLEQTRRLLATAKNQFKIPLKLHVDEFVDLGGVELGIELGAVSVDHLDVTPETTLNILAASDTVGVMLPAVNFNLGSTHFANARYFVDAGGILALSTDINPGSAPTPSLPLIMSIACRYQKLTPAEALNAITINAAAAIQLEDKIGSLEVGKQADIVILDTSDYRAVAYEFGANLVHTVMIEGDIAWSRSSLTATA